MSSMGKLTKFYGSFFLDCTHFAFTPYTLTLNSFLDPQKPKPEELLLGIAACVALSTVIPILPALTSITFAIASFAASLAVASMFLAYPVALLFDALDASERNSTQYVF